MNKTETIKFRCTKEMKEYLEYLKDYLGKKSMSETLIYIIEKELNEFDLLQYFE